MFIMILDKFNISGNLPYDLGFGTLRNVKYNINFRELEWALDLIKNKVINSESNTEAHMWISQVLHQFGVKISFQPVHMTVKLNAWITGEFLLPNSVSLVAYYNRDKAITNGNWFYFKGQILSILMHEIVHYYRYVELGREATDSNDIDEDNFINYFSQTEELYAYSYQILFDLNTNDNRSSLLTLYNKRITNKKTLQKLSKILNKVAKTPIFRSKQYRFEAK